jgi:hypothetical protein
MIKNVNKIIFLYKYIYMGIKQFFRKVGQDTKKFFSKGGLADTTLRKAGNTLSKIGSVAESALPLITAFNPELAPALMAGSALSNIGGQTLKGTRQGILKGKSIEDKITNLTPSITGGLTASRDPINILRGKNQIQAPKPEAVVEEQPVMNFV